MLEVACNLWICAAVSDGASSNSRCYELHGGISENPGEPDEIVHSTVNLFCLTRKIYFFSDAPHLVKTARNCLFNSGSGKRTRHLWSNDKYLLWKHIFRMYFADLHYGLHHLPKLSVDHLVVRPYSKTKVKLAVQMCESLNATHRTYGHLWRNIVYVQKHMPIYFQIKSNKLGKCNNHSNSAQKRWGAKNVTSLLEEEAPPPSSRKRNCRQNINMKNRYAQRTCG